MSDGLRLLRAVMASGSLSAFRELDPDIFLDGPELSAFDIIRGHLRDYGVLPQISTVEDTLEQAIPEAYEPINYYVTRCVDRHLYNEITPRFNQLKDTLKNSNMDGARDACFSLARICRQNQITEDLIDFATLAERVDRQHQRNRLLGDEIPGIRTGWPSIDQKTLGWQNADLVVFVARPEMGKTNILLHTCRHAWASGHSVLFASMEMGPEQIGYRLISQMAGVNPRYYRSGKLSYFAEQRVARALEEFSDRSNAFHFFSGEFKGKTTDALDYAIQEHAPDAVYLDGLYLMKPSDAPRGTKMYEKVAYVVDELKQLCLRRDRPVIATTQFNRASGAKGASGDLESMGYTDALGTHSSIVIAVKNPPATLNPNGVQVRYPDKRVLEFLKGREGEQGSVLVDFKFSPIGFDEIHETEEEREDRLIAQQMEQSNRGRNNSPGQPSPTTAFMRGRGGDE